MAFVKPNYRNTYGIRFPKQLIPARAVKPESRTGPKNLLMVELEPYICVPIQQK